MNRDSDNKTRGVLVTGAAGGGIGSALVSAFARSGGKVLANARSYESFNLAAEQNCWHDTVVPLIADVGDAWALTEAIAEVQSQGVFVDTVICNAATDLPHKTIGEYPDNHWDTEINTILGGAFNACRAVLPEMTSRGYGRIVMISSSSASRGSWGRGVGYSAAKAGLFGLTKQMALELGASGITCNCIAPSQIDTPRIRRNGRKTDESLKAYGEKVVPVGRVGLPSDVVSMVEFLASAEANYITGQIIHIDGGASLASAMTKEKKAK